MAAVGQNIYGGLAEVGKLQATFGLVLAFCIAASCCASGGVTIKNAASDKHTATTSAVVSGVTCTSNACTGTGTYTVSGQTYTLPVTTGVPAPAKVNIMYDPAKPSDAIQNKMSPVVGYALISGGFCLVLCALLGYWLTNTYKPIAALGGASAISQVGQAIF
jgi:hypothetical protein